MNIFSIFKKKYDKEFIVQRIVKKVNEKINVLDNSFENLDPRAKILFKTIQEAQENGDAEGDIKNLKYMLWLTTLEEINTIDELNKQNDSGNARIQENNSELKLRKEISLVRVDIENITDNHQITTGNKSVLRAIILVGTGTYFSQFKIHNEDLYWGVYNEVLKHFGVRSLVSWPEHSGNKSV